MAAGPSLTEEVVEFVCSGTPTSAELGTAAEYLARFRHARDRGASGAVAGALKAVATDDPLWTAWVSGAAAQSVDAELSWVAVCAAADTLVAADDRAAEAVAIGVRVADRIAAQLSESHTEAGWSMSGTAGVIGAAAAVGRALGLDSRQLRDTVGLCATQASGFTAAAGTDADPVQVGKAAANAVEAGLLGQCGFTSSAQPLEGRRGMFAVLAQRPD